MKFDLRLGPLARTSSCGSKTTEYDRPSLLLLIFNVFTRNERHALNEKYDNAAAFHNAVRGHNITTANAEKGLVWLLVLLVLILRFLFPCGRPKGLASKFGTSDFGYKDRAAWGSAAHIRSAAQREPWCSRLSSSCTQRQWPGSSPFLGAPPSSWKGSPGCARARGTRLCWRLL